MTPHLWLLIYISVVLVIGAIAIGWTEGVWRRQQDAREARMHERLWANIRRVQEENPYGKPRRRTFKHRNLRTALNARAQMERGDR